jgi:glycosyltransferase involved in cell wall biosynthesis
MKISLITCFHNSFSRLELYFSALKALKLDGISLEYIFVDNASTDATYTELLRLSNSLGREVHVLKESTPGLMFARCTAVRAAKMDFLLFLDDDNEISSNYLTELCRVNRRFPGSAFISGNSLPPKEYNTSSEIIDVAGIVAIRKQVGEFQFDLDGAHSKFGPWGAGLFGERVSILNACSEWLKTDKKIAGRTGTGLSGGEDHWIIQYVCNQNSKIAFSDKLVLTHRIAPYRLTIQHLAKVSYQLGFDWYDHFTAFKSVRKNLSSGGFDVFKLSKILFVKLPVDLLRFLISRKLVTVMNIAFQIGLAMKLLIVEAESPNKRE